MTVHNSGEQIDAVLAHLRAEEPLEQEPLQQALLRHEIGVLEEGRGHEKQAAREYLAAYNTDPQFREPLEALVAMFGHQRDEKNLPKLLETLVDAATTPEESARALWELAAYRQDIQHDLAGARLCLERAVERNPEDAACWLELELAATREGDPQTRERALEARAALGTDPTLLGLVLIELARLRAADGDLQQAAKLLDQVAAMEGRARYRSRVVLEQIAQDAGEAELGAIALEGQAELVSLGLEGRGPDDAAAARAAGVPSILCRPEVAADAWLRAGELRRRAGDPWGAVAALSGAAGLLGDHPLVARLRLAAAEAAGDTAAVIHIAEEQIAAGVQGDVGSAMWLRLGMAAQQEGDGDRARGAFAKALELDPTNLVALTLHEDMVAAGSDARAYAELLEARAEAEPDSRAPSYQTLSYLWGVEVGDVGKAKEMLDKAAQAGAEPIRLWRLARTLASLVGSERWYEQAIEQLLASSEELADRATLCFELGRSRLLRGQRGAAMEAFTMLASADGPDDGRSPSSWLARTLSAYVVGLGDKHDVEAQVRAGEARPDDLGRGMILVAAASANRAGQDERAVALLRREHEANPGDAVVALLLADLLRGSGDRLAAAEVLARCAASVDDRTLAAATQLEAGFLAWHASLADRGLGKDDAVGAFETALEHAPVAARVVLAWALRAAYPDDLAARRRVAELAEESELDRELGALERFGVGLAARDGHGEATAAIDQLEDLDPGGDLALAAALARLMWADSAADTDAVEAALARIEPLGGAAAKVAAAERFRLARFVERHAGTTLEAARRWSGVEPSVHTALEWLAAAFAADDRGAEADAREALAARLDGDAAEQVMSSAAIVTLLGRPGETPQMLGSTGRTARLVNLELAPPGTDPTRRSRALRGLGDALGAEAERDALRLAAWSDLARGEAPLALRCFKALVEQDPDDLASWEGLRAAAEKTGDHTTTGVALARLGNLCRDDRRAAEMWEQAGLVLLEHTSAHADAEIAFSRALERDKKRAVAFDKLFRRVRARNEDDRLLELIDARLKVTEDVTEVTKMYWERARVLRRKGDQVGALQCLQDVTMLEPDHVGALALAGEIRITRGEFEEAAPLLARLAGLDEAPKQQRLMSGVAAVDLYEKRLGKPEEALKVLLQLHRDGLSTLKVRERLARTAARVGAWSEAVLILERLMSERDSSEGRAEAARLALAIHRDKLKKPEGAEKAVASLLSEIPDDSEAIEVLLRVKLSDELRATALPAAKKLIAARLAREPFDERRVRLVAEISSFEGRLDQQRAALGVLSALLSGGQGTDNDRIRDSIARLDARMAQQPQIVLDEEALLAVGDPQDTGALPALFAMIAEIISEALGPSLKSEGVGRRERIDTGDPLRTEVSRWMGALGLGDFELYVGGRDEQGVRGIAGSKPALLLGSAVRAPLQPRARAAVAREVFALRRGTTAVHHCDDHTLASIATAAAIDAGVATPEPPYAVYREVERAIRKAMSRKLRKAIRGTCEQVLHSQIDPAAWAAAARRSLDRMALIAAGDASIVIDSIVGPPGSPARATMDANARAKHLLSFALSSEYLGLRHKLGMGVK